MAVPPERLSSRQHVNTVNPNNQATGAQQTVDATQWPSPQRGRSSLTLPPLSPCPVVPRHAATSACLPPGWSAALLVSSAWLTGRWSASRRLRLPITPESAFTGCCCSGSLTPESDLFGFGRACRARWGTAERSKKARGTSGSKRLAAACSILVTSSCWTAVYR